MKMRRVCGETKPLTVLAWLNRDVWRPPWPNLASSAVFVGGTVLRIRVHLTRHQEASAMQHAATRKLVSGLHERLDDLGAEQKNGS